jgi:hypothetical protein
VYLPLDANISNYLDKLQSHGFFYHRPMRNVLLLEKLENGDNTTTNMVEHRINSNFVWPSLLQTELIGRSLMISAALPSVTNRWKSNSQESRLEVVENQDSILKIQHFKDKSKNYYESLLERVWTVKMLKFKASRKVKLGGGLLRVHGGKSKNDYVEGIKEFDLDFINYLNQPLRLEESTLVENQLFDPSSSTALEETIVTTIGNINISRKLLRELQPTCCVDNILMSAIVNLFIERDELVKSCHRDQHFKDRGYEDRKTTLFHLFEDINNIRNSDLNILPVSIDECPYHRSYIIFKTRQTEIALSSFHWAIVEIDFTEGKIYYIDPMGPSDTSYVNIKGVVNEFYLPRIFGGSFDWNMINYDHQYYDLLKHEKAEDSGLYVFLILYFLVQDIPIVFTRNDLDLARYKLVYRLLSSKLEY